MRFTTLILISMILSSQVMAQKVTFRLFSPDLPDSTTVYVTGNVPMIGNWDPGAVPMRYEGDQYWIKTIELPETLELQYKYTLGDWSREGAHRNGTPLSNFVVAIQGDTVLSDQINQWTHTGKKGKLEFKGQVTGQVQVFRNMEADSLLPRDLVIWLPENYDTSGQTRYPVLYMHDAQNLFDPETSSFGVDWQVDETCTRLIMEKKIPPMIVVGTTNTTRRRAEYDPQADGMYYLKFLAEELKPAIDDIYPTDTSRESTFIGGSSMGGLISFAATWYYPEVFSKSICMSPAFRIRHIDFVGAIADQPLPDPPVKFYIDNGGVDLEVELQPGINDMLELLQKKGLKSGEDYLWVYAPEARHFEADWAARMPAAIQWLFED